MNVQCSWKISDDRTISDAIFYNRDTDDIDLEDEINVENCILLKAPDKCEGLYPTVPACQLLICCEPPNCISRISAISEARVIEVYGHHGEYLKTVFNYPLDESDNLFVFRGDIQLDKPLSVCSIKFVNLQSPNEMWLFGVKIHIDRTTGIPQNPISLSTIAQKLEHVGDSLDNKEEILKQCFGSLLKMGLPKFSTTKSSENLQNYMSAQEIPTSDEITNAFLKESTAQMNKEKDANDVMESLLKLNGANAELKCNFASQVQNSVSTCTSPVIFTNQSHSVSTQTEEEYVNLEETLKSYINEKIEGINKKFLEMETKLLCKLDEIESFIKPHGTQNNN